MKTFAYGAATAQGAWPRQEDGFYVDPVRGMFGLADGFGSKGAGESAARALLTELSREKHSGSIASFKQQRELFTKVNQALLKAPGERGGCSALVAHLSGEGGQLSQCGACAAWVWRAGKLHPLLAAQAEPAEDFQPLIPDQALGLGEKFSLESRSFHWQKGDLLLLVSGGSCDFPRLATYLPGEDLAIVAQELVESAVALAPGWNHSLILVGAPI